MWRKRRRRSVCVCVCVQLIELAVKGGPVRTGLEGVAVGWVEAGSNRIILSYQ